MIEIEIENSAYFTGPSSVSVCLCQKGSGSLNSQEENTCCMYSDFYNGTEINSRFQ